MTTIDLGGLYRELDELLAGLKYCVDVEWWNHRREPSTPTLKVWVQWETTKDKSYAAPTAAELLATVRREVALHATDVEVTL